MSYWERFRKLKEIIVVIIKGIFGIISEIGYALTIMAVAFFICIIVVFL